MKIYCIWSTDLEASVLNRLNAIRKSNSGIYELFRRLNINITTTLNGKSFTENLI